MEYVSDGLCVVSVSNLGLSDASNHFEEYMRMMMKPYTPSR